MELHKFPDKRFAIREDHSRIKFVNAALHEMAQSELMAMISPAQLVVIKATDPNPKFRAYVVGHEGESSGQISTDNVTWIKVVKKWFTSAIRTLHDKIMIGTQLFQGHSPGVARTPIGEVVGKKLADISDRLSVIVAAYIKPAFANLPLDVASIEADIDLIEDGSGGYIAEAANVHAIALSNKNVDTPGFKGAQLITQLFEFAEHGKYKFQGANNLEITIEDVKKLIKAESIKPSDIFNNSELSDDPSVKGFIEAAEKKTEASFHERFRRHEDKLKEAEGEGDKKKEELEKENTKLKTEVAKSKVDSLFDAAKTDRKFSDKQAKFIKERNSTFEPTDPEKLEDEYSKFLDDRVDEFKKISKDIFGEEVKEPEKGDQKKDDSEKDDSATGPASEEQGELKDNPFID